MSDLSGRAGGRWWWTLLLAGVLLVLVIDQLFSRRDGEWLFLAVLNLILAQVLTFLAGYNLRVSRNGAVAGGQREPR